MEVIPYPGGDLAPSITHDVNPIIAAAFAVNFKLTLIILRKYFLSNGFYGSD